MGRPMPPIPPEHSRRARRFSISGRGSLSARSDGSCSARAGSHSMSGSAQLQPPALGGLQIIVVPLVAGVEAVVLGSCGLWCVHFPPRGSILTIDPHSLSAARHSSAAGCSRGIWIRNTKARAVLDL